MGGTKKYALLLLLSALVCVVHTRNHHFKKKSIHQNPLLQKLRLCPRLSLFRVYKAVSEIVPNRLALSRAASDRFEKLTESDRRHSICSRDTFQTITGSITNIHMCKKPIIKQTSLDFAQRLYNELTQMDTTKRETEDAKNKEKHSRSRRSVTHNSDGSTTTINSCNPRGSEDSDGTQTLCAECNAETVLAQDRYPRYINEIICDNADSYCLTYQGACVQNYIYMTFKRDTTGAGLGKLDEWTDYQQAVRNGCHCQLFKPSVFDVFI